MGRPKRSRRSVRLSVTLDEDGHKVVREMADAMDLLRPGVVRRAVSEFIERHERERKDCPYGNRMTGLSKRKGTKWCQAMSHRLRPCPPAISPAEV
jgi:hypothetical protein